MSLDERVLVVSAALFDGLGRFQGFSPEVDRYLDALLAPGVARFEARRDVEDDPSLKQLISYAVFRCGDGVFTYTRGGSGGEARLRRLRSLGVGGHVSEGDAGGRATAEAYEAALARELAEEVSLADAGPIRPRRVGLINDDATPVGRVHLGVVHLFELGRPSVIPLEDALADPAFVAISDLPALSATFESWSQICISAFLEA